MITLDQLADTIYRVEGGNQTSHPYGIMVSYKHTTPRQACINTIKHAMHDYKAVKIDHAFIYFLADRYCPPSVDPQGNKNWKVNVVRILNL